MGIKNELKLKRSLESKKMSSHLELIDLDNEV